jgi:hypothetical protein
MRARPLNDLYLTQALFDASFASYGLIVRSSEREAHFLKVARFSGAWPLLVQGQYTVLGQGF